MQETATRALEKPPRHERNLQAWMKRIARNLAMSESRKNKIRRERVAERTPASFSDGYSTEPLPDLSLEAAEASSDLLQVIGQLPEKQRVIVLRRFHQEVPIAQIAKDFEISEIAVQKTIERARDNCRKVLRSRHGNGWAVPCLLVIQQPDRLAPITPLLGSESASTSSLSGASKIGLGLAAGLAVALPLLLPADPVEASTSFAPPLGTIGVSAAGGSIGGLLGDFQPDQSIRIGGPATTATEAGRLATYKIFVQDTSGAPLEGVPILKSESGSLGSGFTLRPHRYFEQGSGAALDPNQARTDAAGQLELGLPIDQETQLLAVHPDYVLQRMKLVPSASDQEALYFRLTPAAHVAGKVVDAVGRPVQGVSVAAHPSRRGHYGSQQPEFHAVTNAAGEFQMVALKPDNYSFRLYGNSTATIWSESMELTAGQNSARLTTRSGNDVVGEVLDPEGKPLVGARVWLVREEELHFDDHDPTPPRGLQAVTVDPKTGRFTVHNALSDGLDRLLVRARGHQSVNQPLSDSGAFQSFQLERSSLSLTTRVLYERAPVDGAIVYLSWNHGSGWSPHSRGQRTVHGIAQFELSSVSPGTHFDLTVVHEDGTAFRSSEVIHEPNGELTIDLYGGTPVTLRVIDANGQPVPDFEVAATAYLDDPGAIDPILVRFVSDANGESTLRLPNSTLEFSPQLPDQERLHLHPQPVVVANGAPIQREIVVHPRFARTFQALDQDGTPIVNRMITFRSADGSVLPGGVTGSDGRLSAQQLIPGSFTPLLSPGYEVSTTRTTQSGAPIQLDQNGPEQLELRFPGLHTLQLQVALPDGPAAARKFSLTPDAHELGGFAALAYAIPTFELDESGRAELTHLLPGEYWLKLPQQANQPAVMTRLSLPQPNDSFVWRIPSARLEGAVEWTDSSQLDGKLVHLAPITSTAEGVAIDPRAAGLPAVRVSLDHQGRFVFPFVPSGTWEIISEDLGDGHVLRHRLRVDAEANKELQLGTLKPSSTGTLRVELSPSQQSRLSSKLISPRVGVFSLLSLETNTWFDLPIAKQGQAERSDLPEGRYQLHLFGQPVQEVQFVPAAGSLVLLVE